MIMETKKIMSDKWDTRFLKLAKEISTWSKDPSTQVGAIAVKDRRILSTGYNGFPRGISDAPSWYNHKETKYKYVVHAEMNCIYNATESGVSLSGSTLYVYPLPVCPECAKGVIQTGVKRVVMALGNDKEKWNDLYKRDTSKMFKMVDIYTEFISLE
jgi:dCMP deaminase